MVKVTQSPLSKLVSDQLEGGSSTPKKGGKIGSAARRRQLRQRLWPLIEDDALWLRTKSVGFTTIPRTLPLINRIVDDYAGKGFPVSSTYLALWCQVFDEGFVEVRNPREFAYESGFSGPRAEATWKARMKILQEMGIIDAKPGVYGEFQFVLMFNPHLVINAMYVTMPNDLAYQALLGRMMHVGATDLDL